MTRLTPETERLKKLELKLAECLGEASSMEAPMAATLIGAALEEIGLKIEQQYGVHDIGSDEKVRYDN